MARESGLSDSTQTEADQTEHTATESGRVIQSGFRPARWLGNSHLQTIFPSLPFPVGPKPELKRDYLNLPDGDVTVVDSLTVTDDPEAPLLVLLHGLESSSESSYARHLLQAAADAGWNSSVLHFRDCGDYRNRLPRRYHAGETNDLRYYLSKIRTDGFSGPLVTVGYSLGGNVLLKYLGEDGPSAPVEAAAAICVPLSLQMCADALTTGFSKIYQKHLLKRMKEAVRRKFDRHTAAFDWDRAMNATTFSDFDDAVTAPLHGFSGKDEYYGRCSSIGYLKSIDRPTLILNARDDPFMLPEMLPDAEALAPSVTLEISEHGGHVGFIGGGTPWRPSYYLPSRIVEFLTPFTEPDAADHHALPGM